jgi:hypothetical protein
VDGFRWLRTGTVAGSLEDDNEVSGCIKSGEFNWLSETSFSRSLLKIAVD